MILSEQDLINKIRCGDQAAFKKIYNLYRNKLFSYAFRFTKSEQLSEEIIHDVFLKIWQKRKELRTDLSFSAFLYKITKNYTINSLKRIAIDERAKKEIIHYFEKLHNDIENLMDYVDLEQFALQAVEALPPQRKLVFKMSRENNMTHKEIALALGISPNTVKNHMIEALKSIRNYFEGHVISLVGFLFLFLTNV